MMWTKLLEMAKKRPFLVNTASYSFITGFSEFTQQTVTYKIVPKVQGEPVRKYDFSSLARFTVLGGLIFSPILFYWYKWLDKTFPGVTKKVIFKKISLDVTVVAVPLYSLFYAFLGATEGKDVASIQMELRTKLLPTLAAGALFWVPAQYFNFKLVPPHARVIYIAACTFVEVNILAVLKKIEI